MGNKQQLELFKKLNRFIKKYYLNKLVQGGIYFFSILIIFFIIFSFLEYFTQPDVGIRTFLFWAYIFLNLFIAIKFIFSPLLKLLKIGKIITHDKAATIIGLYFSQIKKHVSMYKVPKINTKNKPVSKEAMDILSEGK